jgi:hypothetical protein
MDPKEFLELAESWSTKDLTEAWGRTAASTAYLAVLHRANATLATSLSAEELSVGDGLLVLEAMASDLRLGLFVPDVRLLRLAAMHANCCTGGLSCAFCEGVPVEPTKYAGVVVLARSVFDRLGRTLANAGVTKANP